MVGNCAIYDSDKDLYHGMNLLRIEPNENVEPSFLIYLLKSHFFNEKVRAVAKHAINQVSVSTTNLKALSVLLPPLTEQRAIAAFLDRKTEAIDALIQKKEQLIERLKEKRQALITRAVTKGLDPNVPMRDSGIGWLGEVPEEWDLIKFKHVVHLVNDSIEHSEFSIALENIESWTGNYIKTDSNYNASGTLFKKGDVLFGKLRPYLAKVYLAGKLGKAIGDIYVFRGQKVISEYLFMIVDSKAFIDIVNSSTYGAKMPRASWDFVGEIKLPIPDIEKQKEVVNKVESRLKLSDLLVDKIDAEIQKLKEYRQSLISAVVTGKIDVRDEVEVESNEVMA